MEPARCATTCSRPSGNTRMKSSRRRGSMRMRAGGTSRITPVWPTRPAPLGLVTADDAEAVKFLNDALRMAQRDGSTPAEDEEDAMYLLNRRLHIVADAMHQLARRECTRL